jgi:hypothetical protein
MDQFLAMSGKYVRQRDVVDEIVVAGAARGNDGGGRQKAASRPNDEWRMANGE